MGQSSSVPFDATHHHPRANHLNHQSNNIQTPKQNQNNNTDSKQSKKENSEETLKIPSAWKTKEQEPKNFEVISPQSDISNPSHFRGLFVTHPATTTTATTKHHHHHRRISKVVMKVSPPPFIKQKIYATASTTTMSMPQRRRSDLQQTPPPPLPARFYFPGHDDDDEDDNNNNNRDANNVAKEEKKEEDKEGRRDSTNQSNGIKVGQRSTYTTQPHENQVSRKSNVKTSSNEKTKKHRTINYSKFTRKCIKAKSALSECWKDHVTDNVFQHNEGPPNVQRHYSQREVASLQQHHEKGTDDKGFEALIPMQEKRNPTATSFQPVWKETNMVLSSSVSNPIPNIPTHSNEISNKKSIQDKEDIGTDPDASNTNTNVVSTGRVRDIIRTFSQETSMSTVLQSSKAVSTTSNYSQATTAVSTIVQLHPPYSNDLAATKIDKNNISANTASIFRPSMNSDTACKKYSTSSTSTKTEYLPILTKTTTLTTNPTGSSESSASISNIKNIINQTSDKSSQLNRKRASIEKKSNERPISGSALAPSKSTTFMEIKNKLNDGHHKRRSEISIEMQRQIDQQLLNEMKPNNLTASKKVQRLRQRYQHDLIEKKKQSSNTATEPVNFPIKAPANTSPSISSRAMTVAEARKAFENTSCHVMPVSFTKHRNATSVPNRKSDEHDQRNGQIHQQFHSLSSASTSHPIHRRSISVPRGRGEEAVRPSIDHSALLLLSKSWDDVASKTRTNRPLQKADQQQALPVLLQMAGWNPPVLEEKSRKLTNETLLSQNIVNHDHTKLTRSSDQGIFPNDKPKLLDESVVTMKSTRKAKSFEFVKTIPGPQSQRFDKSANMVRKSTGNTTGSSGGRTIAFMLQQAYFGDDSDDDQEDATKRKVNDYNTASAYGYLNHLVSPDARVTSSFNIKNEMKILAACSPALSIDSSSTLNSIPVVSEQATFNADFLFAQDGFNMRQSCPMTEANCDTTLHLKSDETNHIDNTYASRIEHCKNLSGSTSFKLSTMDSRNRIVTSSSSVASTIKTIVQHPTTTSSIVGASSTSATIVQHVNHVADVEESILSKPSNGFLSATATEPRRVRFSVESFLLKNKDVSTTANSIIETKLSDLTESTVQKQVHHNRESAGTSTLCIDSIPEEDGIEIKENTPSKDKRYSTVARWSYRTSRSLSTTSSSSDERGVTPLLGNKTKLNIGSRNETLSMNSHQRTTNSPYLRFKRAKERFASSDGAATKKIVPQKRASPIKAVKKSNAMVLARIASMENKKQQGFVRCNSTSSADPSVGVLKASALITKSAELKQHGPVPHDTFLQHRLKHKINPSSIQEMATRSSPMLINGHVVSSPIHAQLNGSLETYNVGLSNEINTLNESASVVSYDSDDVFGAILHPTTIDDSGEDDSAEIMIQSDFGNDDFDRLMNNTESYGNDQKASTAVDQKEAPSRRPSSGAAFLSSAKTSDATGSVTSAVSSCGDSASVLPRWLLHQGGQHRTSVVTTTSEASSVMSAVSRMKNVQNGTNFHMQTLPFRAVAPVQPKQQQSNGTTGINVEPPRTWRKLAVVAQLQDMKHLQQANNDAKENTKSGDCNKRHHDVQHQRYLKDCSKLQ